MGVLGMACDADRRVIARHAERFPGVRYTTRARDIFEDPAIAAVVIAAPAAAHYELVKQGLDAGKDVFVEKPLALTAAEGAALVRRAKVKNRLLMVGHILQYHPAVIQLKKLIKNGALGNIQYLYSSRLNIGKLRTEENILWSFAPHDISVILSLVGTPPVKITGSGASYVSRDVYDVTLTSLEFASGVKAHIFVSWLHPFKEQKLVVVGSRAMAVFDDLSPEKLCLYPHRIKWKNGNIPVAHKSDRRLVFVEDREPLNEELRHFVDCVARRKTPRTDGAEGLRVLKVLEGIEQAIREG